MNNATINTLFFTKDITEKIKRAAFEIQDNLGFIKKVKTTLNSIITR